MAKAALKEGQLFVKTVMALLTGDQDKAIATRNARLAISATKGQISALEGELVKQEIKAENAAESLKSAKFPTTAIGEPEQYIKNVQKAQEAYDDATESVKDVEASIDYFKAQLAEFLS